MRKIIKEKREIKYKIIEKIDRNTITIRHLILKIQYSTTKPEIRIYHSSSGRE